MPPESPFSKAIYLNVGGRQFVSTIGTLCREPGSYFSCMFSSAWAELSQNCAENAVFIDRDSDRFAFVLDYLRDGLIGPLPDDIGSIEKLLADTDYYQLPQMKMIIQQEMLDRKRVFFSYETDEVIDKTQNHPGYPRLDSIYFSELNHKFPESLLVSQLQSEILLGGQGLSAENPFILPNLTKRKSFRQVMQLLKYGQLTGKYYFDVEICLNSLGLEMLVALLPQAN